MTTCCSTAYLRSIVVALPATTALQLPHRRSPYRRDQPLPGKRRLALRASLRHPTRIRVCKATPPIPRGVRLHRAVWFMPALRPHPRCARPRSLEKHPFSYTRCRQVPLVTAQQADAKRTIRRLALHSKRPGLRHTRSCVPLHSRVSHPPGRHAIRIGAGAGLPPSFRIACLSGKSRRKHQRGIAHGQRRTD